MTVWNERCLFCLLHLLKTCFGEWILRIWPDREGRTLLDLRVLIVQRPVAEGAFLAICLLVVEIEGLQEGEAAQERLVVDTVCCLWLYLLLLLILFVDHIFEALVVQFFGRHLSKIQFVFVKTSFDSKSFR